MLKRMIFACVTALLPVATTFAMDEYRSLHYQTVKGALYQLGEMEFEEAFGDVDSVSQEGCDYEDNYDYEDYGDQEWTQDDNHTSDLEWEATQEGCDDEEDRNEWEQDDEDSLQSCDDREGDNNVEGVDDDENELAPDPHPHDVVLFTKMSRAQKRATDLRKDKPEYVFFKEQFKDRPVYDTPTKEEKRRAYKTALDKEIITKVSLRRAEKFASEPDWSRKHEKMRKALNRVTKRMLRERSIEMRQQCNSSDESEETVVSQSKPNSWQPDAPEVIIDKRLQDSHRQFRAPVVKKSTKTCRNPKYKKSNVRTAKIPTFLTETNQSHLSRERPVCGFRMHDGRWR